MHVTFVDKLYTGPAPTVCGLQGFDKYGIDQRSATATARLQKALGLKVSIIIVNCSFGLKHSTGSLDKCGTKGA